MTNEEKTKALAELDGFTSPVCGCGIRYGQSILLTRYLTSYDAIIPLIRKLTTGEAIDMANRLNVRPGTTIWDCTPEQLCDALIKAVGKWKE